jgi:hypothetical protein
LVKAENKKPKNKSFIELKESEEPREEVFEKLVQIEI